MPPPKNLPRIIGPRLVVYMLVSPSGKYYIGMTTQGLLSRWWQHVTAANRGDNSALCRAIRKYGASSFEKHVLVTCSTVDELRSLEVLFISAFRSFHPAVGYNQTMGGEGVIPNEEMRKKISARMMGHPVSAEVREKLRKANLGKKGKFQHTEESLRKLREARLKNNPGGFKPGHTRVTIEQREAIRQRMVTNNPMKRPESVAKLRSWKRTTEHCMHISQAKKGKKVPALSAARKGRIPWNKRKRMAKRKSTAQGLLNFQ